MRDWYGIVDRLKNGFFDHDSEKLLFSVQKIEAEIPVNDVFDGSFEINSKGGREVHGRVFTSCMRLVCMTGEFEAAHAEVKYGFDSTGLEPGSVIKGDIQIVSDAGEYYIPFVFSIVRSISKTSYGKVKNLFHFSNAAQMEWKEAVNLFYSDEFKYIFEGNDRIHFDKYRGYSMIPGNELNVELFLRAIRKKQKIGFKTERSTYEFLNVGSDLKCEISVKKSTWGYIDITVSADVPFIELDKERITAEDFLGNIYLLTFYLREEKLHAGKNYGKIKLTSAEGKELEIEIIASYRESDAQAKIVRREMQNLTVRLMQLYLSFRTKQINSGTWVKDSMRIVERMNSVNVKNPISRLYQTQLLLVEGRVTEAKWILEHVAAEMNITDRGDETYCYFRYLCTLYSREENFVNEVCAEIEKIYNYRCKSPFILWILIYLDEELSNNSPKKISLIEEQFKRSCSSPILYVEAYNYFTANPASLNKLTGFELQVINFALRHFILDRELLNQLIYLAGRVKTPSKLLIEVMEKAYDLTGNDKIVETICSLLIKNNMTDKVYFKWYSLGVEKDVNITRLYEYYMYSIPFDYDKLILKPVILYFGFRNDLGYEKMALLYANLIEHKAQNPSLYESNREKMIAFAVSQIEEEHMNRELSVIYEDALFVQLIKPELARHFVRILLSHEVAVKDESIVKVVIIEEALKKEREYPVERGYAYPVIYTREFTAFYEDKKGNRYVAENRDFHRVMEDALFIRVVQDHVTNDPGFALYVCNLRHRYVVIDHENVDYFRELTDSDEIRESYKEDIRMGLIRYYSDNNMLSALDEYIINLDPKKLSARDRAELIDHMVRRGMYDRAYELITIYGAEEIVSKICVKICSHMIARKDETADPMLIKFAYYAFVNGKYDILTIRYLTGHFEGLTKEMRNLWKAASQMEVECQELREKLLIQMMYTGTTIGEKSELFEEYVKEGSRTDVELSYLSYQAYDYFARERVTDDRVFYHLIKNYRRGETLNDAGKLALLKYYAADNSAIRKKDTESEKSGKTPDHGEADKARKRSERIKDMLREFLLEYLHKNCHYRFFASYRDLVPELASYEDKTIIEYRSDPSHRVFLHYIIEQSEQEKEHYVTEEMTPLFGGIFSKEFVLFFGENLQYYIMDESDGQQRLTFSDAISISETNFSEDTSRYNLLNDMVVATTLQDDETVFRLMEEYAEADYFAEHAFTII